MENIDKQTKIRKLNMKIFPTYRALGWDYLFYYTINFLFFTQIKNISASAVVLKEAFYAFFRIIFQIPANIIVEFFGRRNSIVLANFLNCFYMVVIIFSRNLGDLIFGEFISAVAFSIKEIAEPSLLGNSIPPSKYKSEIYSRMVAKGTSRYYILNALSKIIAGFLFTINGYIPIVCSLIILVIATIISIAFMEPIKGKKTHTEDISAEKQIKDIKDGFIYVLKSERLKALILSSALIATVIRIVDTYNVSLLQEIGISSAVIGIISAFGSYISSHSSRMQEKIHKKFRNKTLTLISLTLSINCLIAGICGALVPKYVLLIVIIIASNLVFTFGYGIYFIIIDKYLSSFANHKIDTKIFAANSLISNLFKGIGGLVAAFLLDRVTTAYCMIIMGVVFTIVFILVEKYMKTRVGLKPEEYSKEEVKYDELKEEFEKENEEQKNKKDSKENKDKKETTNTKSKIEKNEKSDKAAKKTNKENKTSK